MADLPYGRSGQSPRAPTPRGAPTELPGPKGPGFLGLKVGPTQHPGPKGLGFGDPGAPTQHPGPKALGFGGLGGPHAATGIEDPSLRFITFVIESEGLG